MTTKLTSYLLILWALAACTSVPAGHLADLMQRDGYSAAKLHKNGANHFEVRAQINGVWGVFILDTGASGSVIDKRQAEKYKLELGEEMLAGGVGTDSKQGHYTLLRTIKIGNYKRRDYRVSVIDLSHVNRALASQGVRAQDGVIGSDILSDGHAVIDYASGVLYLKR